MKIRNRKGQVSIYIAWVVMAVIIVVIGAVVAPMGVLFNTKMYAAGDDILAMAQDDLDGIQNAEVRASINGSIEAARGSAQQNIEVNSDLFQYSWVLVLVLTAIVMFLLTRRVVEYGQGGFI